MLQCVRGCCITGYSHAVDRTVKYLSLPGKFLINKRVVVQVESGCCEGHAVDMYVAASKLS